MKGLDRVIYMVKIGLDGNVNELIGGLWFDKGHLA